MECKPKGNCKMEIKKMKSNSTFTALMPPTFFIHCSGQPFIQHFFFSQKMVMTNSFARTHSFISNNAFLLFEQWRAKATLSKWVHCWDYKSFRCKSIRPFLLWAKNSTYVRQLDHCKTLNRDSVRELLPCKSFVSVCCMHALAFVHSTAVY